MQRSAAPYADSPIPLSLRSAVGLRYRTLNCIECGQEFLERNANQLFRIGSNSMPGEAHVEADGFIHGVCGKCEQKYTVTLSATVQTVLGGIPLYLQPQSIFLVSAPAKRLRDIHCLECGKAFFSISDRIELFADNVTPIEMIEPGRLGPLEPRCKFQHCKQHYHVRV